MAQTQGNYYLPEPSYWPLVGSIGLFTLMAGFANWLHGGNSLVMIAGAIILVIMIFGWFGKVIDESQSGKYNDQVDLSFRMGMVWFIFSEVMFFAAFFGALFYARQLSVPWLGGAGNNFETHALLWPQFDPQWPLIITPDGSENAAASAFDIPKDIIGAWGVPFYNTLILLTSGLTVTWSHWGLKKNSRWQLITGLFLTVALGVTFVILQGWEYGHAYQDLNLKLSSGIYGSTFFMLTGFHGLHVTIGAIMLLVMLIRAIKGHFSAKHHFAFEAAAWYWHFVDVVWLGLFIFVYWL